MKMVATSLIFALVLALTAPLLSLTRVPIAMAHSGDVNHLANPTVNTIDATTKKPTGWGSGNWGSNTAQFSVRNVGTDRTNKSLYVTVSNYVDGDAKWYFIPVAVESSTEYTYADRYKSSVATQVVAMIESSTGEISYQYLGDAARSTAWKNYSVTFTTPANAKTLSIFHLIAANGYLQTDDFSLKEATPPTPIPSDAFVPNSSVEQSDPAAANQPQDWRNNSWGTNSAAFEYLNEGHIGTHSVKTEITSYTDGDAKWYFTPKTVTPGAHYTISDYYKSNIVSHLVVMVETTNGTQYFGLKDAPAASNWTHYSDTFIIPQNAKQMSVFHLIAGVGYLITDDYSVAAYKPVALTRSLISLTFDDAWDSIHANGLPVMQKYSVPSTQYLTTGFLNHDPYMSDSDANDFKASGHQIAAHTVSHAHLTLLSPVDLAYQLTQSRDDLQTKFGPIPALDFASPYGEYNTAVINALKDAGYRSHRSVEPGYNAKDNFNIWNIKVQNILTTTTQNEVNTWLDRAAQDKTWLVLVYHQIDNSGSTYSTTPQHLDDHIQAIKNRTLSVVTVDQAINEILPQLPS